MSQNSVFDYLHEYSNTQPTRQEPPEQFERLEVRPGISNSSQRSLSLPTEGTITLPTLGDTFHNHSWSPEMPPPTTDSLSDIDLDELVQSISPSTRELQQSSEFVSSDDTLQDQDEVENLGKNDVEKDLDTYSLAEIIEEAERKYGDKKPSFCIHEPRETRRKVRLAGSEEEIFLTFRAWMEGPYGYWLLTDPIGDEYIVQHVKGRYYTWQGIAKGLSNDPVTYTIHAKANKDRSSVVEDSECESDTGRSRLFRARTIKQEKPYQAYNVQKSRELKGIPSTESDIEEILTQKHHTTDSKRKVKTRKESTDHKRRRDSSVTTPESRASRSTVSSSRQASEGISVFNRSRISDDIITQQVVLRTRLDKSDGPAIPMYLRDIQNIEQFFARLQQKWAFALADRQIAYCVLKFDWLDDDKTILVHLGDEDGYILLFEELRRAPGWQKEEQVNVAVEIYTA